MDYTYLHKIFLVCEETFTSGESIRVEFTASLLKKEETVLEFDERTSFPEAVHVNQIGYRPSDPSKKACLSAWMGPGGGIEQEEHPILGQCGWQDTWKAYAYAPDGWSSYYYASAASRMAYALRDMNEEKSKEYGESALKAFRYAEKWREENRISDLQEKCRKKGLDFDVENEKYLKAVAEKEAKRATKASSELAK